MLSTLRCSCAGDKRCRRKGIVDLLLLVVRKLGRLLWWQIFKDLLLISCDTNWTHPRSVDVIFCLVLTEVLTIEVQKFQLKTAASGATSPESGWLVLVEKASKNSGDFPSRGCGAGKNKNKSNNSGGKRK